MSIKINEIYTLMTDVTAIYKEKITVVIFSAYGHNESCDHLVLSLKMIHVDHMFHLFKAL
ncbi:hypothetical protein ACJX0J_034260, partial [Zea mays]